MDNNHSEFDSYASDPFDNPLFLQHVLTTVDPTYRYIPESNVLPRQQQNDALDLFTEPILNQDNNNFFSPIGGNFEAGSFTIRDHEPMFDVNNNIFSNGGGLVNFEPDPLIQTLHVNENVGPQNDKDMVSLPCWPPMPKPFFCSCCQVLRHIIHTNGSEFEKLEIHGMIGMISHAIIKNITPHGPPSVSHQMIDFCHKTAEQVKGFLVEYCARKNELGYITVEDPLSAHYEALCTGLDWAVDISDEADDFIPVDDPEPEPEPESSNGKTSSSKPNMSVQREKVANMTLNDFSGVFHIPIKAAAVKLGVCTSAMKKVCRRASLKRWPQRKVKSLEKKVGILKRALGSANPDVRARTRAEIQRLQQQMIDSCCGIVPTGIEMLQF